MRFGSVCSGIEAASVAWHPLGWEAAWLSEIEPFPSAVLAHHYPYVSNLGDMTLLPERILSGEVEAPDVFCGGTPCQAFSVAGLRNSLDDARGNLSLTFVGIANAIDHVRSVRSAAPGIVFWENVPGVLSTKDNAFGCFLGALAGESDPLIPSGGKWTNAGCVFGPQRAVAWRVLDAQYFGVAQRRKRVFVVASARADFNPAKVLFEFDSVRRDIAPSREKGQAIAPCVTNGPPFSRTGNERVEAEAMVAVRMVAFGEYVDDGTASAMKARDYKDATDLVAQPIPLNTMTMQGRPSDEGRMGSGIGEPGDPCPTLTKGHSHAVAQPIPIHDQATRHAGKNGEKTIGKGNGFGVGQEGDPMNTLTKGDRHAVAQPMAFTTEQTPKYNNDQALTLTKQSPTGGGQPQCVMQSMAVRRLTPVECERLQGFPYNYTNIPWRKKDESPDGPRYKALGNSWAVPVVRWIGHRIQQEINK